LNRGAKGLLHTRLNFLAFKTPGPLNFLTSICIYIYIIIYIYSTKHICGKKAAPHFLIQGILIQCLGCSRRGKTKPTDTGEGTFKLDVALTFSGWWFGTFSLFPFSWEFHNPNWLIFFRGVGIPPASSVFRFQPLIVYAMKSGEMNTAIPWLFQKCLYVQFPCSWNIETKQINRIKTKHRTPSKIDETYTICKHIGSLCFISKLFEAPLISVGRKKCRADPAIRAESRWSREPHLRRDSIDRVPTTRKNHKGSHGNIRICMDIVHIYIYIIFIPWFTIIYHHLPDYLDINGYQWILMDMKGY